MGERQYRSPIFLDCGSLISTILGKIPTETSNKDKGYILLDRIVTMADRSESERITAFSLGALMGVAVAVFAVLFRRLAPRAPAATEGSEGEQVSTSGVSQTQGRPDVIPKSSLPTPLAQREPGIQLRSAWTTPTKYIVSVFLFLAALVIVYIGRGVIPMVITAAVLALFINPLIHYLSRRMSWGRAVTVTYILVMLALAAGLLLVIPSLLDTINLFVDFDYQGLAGNAVSGLDRLKSGLHSSPMLQAALVPVLETVKSALQAYAEQAQLPFELQDITLASLVPQLAGTLVTLANILGPVVTLLLGIIITLLISLQMSLAARHVAGWYPDLVPDVYKPELISLIGEISQTWTSFLRGQLTLMLIIGLTTILGNAVLGVPQALFLGIIAGLLELIPSVGPTLAAIPAVLLALLFGSTHFAINHIVFALLVLGLYVLVQFIENQFLVPYVMGDAVNLPPVIVLVGTIAGAMAFGVLGALLATPVIATGNIIFRYAYRKILEPPPLPPEPEPEPSYLESFKGWVRGLRLPGRKRA
jgi:predicted PurR-regulated permease PerM